VPDAAYYLIFLFDKDLRRLYSIKTMSSSYVFPAGVLKENSVYRYQVVARGEFPENDTDNVSYAPFGSGWRRNMFFTSETPGFNVPILSIDKFGVAVWHVSHPRTEASVYYLVFPVLVTDPDGVPENIKSMEVTYPDGSTKPLLKYSDNPEWGFNYLYVEALEDISSIQDTTNSSGIYTFRLEDFEGHVVTMTDTLDDVASNLLPRPENLGPPDGTNLTGTTPLIKWDPVLGASYYKVRIMSAWSYPTIHMSSELTQTSYVVPSGILEPDTTYSYLVYAFEEPIGAEVDFYSCITPFFGLAPRFKTGTLGSKDTDGDGIPDDYEMAMCTDVNNPDTDGDSISDGNEDLNHNGIVDPGETNPCSKDTDNDGMPDGWEKDNGLNPTVNDALLDGDGDGYSNLREFLAGSDPNQEDQTLPTVGNFDTDEDSDGTDLQVVASEFNRKNCSESEPCECDLDGDGDVDNIDLALFAEDFGRIE